MIIGKLLLVHDALLYLLLLQAYDLDVTLEVKRVESVIRQNDLVECM